MKEFSPKTLLAAALLLSMVLTACTPWADGQGTEASTAPTSQAVETVPSVDAGSDFNSMRITQIMDSEQSLTWVFAGDSITHNGSWTQGMNGYPEWFEQFLCASGRADDSVVATAWGGADIQDFLLLEDTPSGNGIISDPGMGLEQFVTKYNPDVVFVMVGTNNRGMSDEEFRSYYELMLNGIYSEGRKNGKIPKIIILSPPPISGDSVYNTEQTDYDSTWRFQKNLKQIAQDWNLLFVDMQTAFTQEALVLGSDYAYMFFTDPSDGGLHPNAAGHYLMFKTLCQTLGLYREDMSIFRMEYEDFVSASLYPDDTVIANYIDEFDSFNWAEMTAENSLWAVVGGAQMSGYQGAAVNRSLFRLLDNGIRGGENNIASCRDIRLLNLASPDYTMAYLAQNYDAVIGEHQDLYDVLLLLPEISEIYDDAYQHSESKVADYKADVETLIEKNRNKLVVLWTPLASADADINRIVNDYAEAIRQIAAEDPSVFFYDVNRFMNQRIQDVPSLVNNWFEEDMYITPLCATDIAYAFYSHTFLSGTNKGELVAHNLRLTADQRTFKGPYVRDNIAAEVAVSDGTITVDASAILAKYPDISDLRVAVLPVVGAGNYSEDIWTIASFDGSTCTFEAPYTDPVITVYGELNECTYRFKDQTLAVETDNQQSKPATASTTLTSLEVIGAPEFSFDPALTTYNVELYQYQRNVQIRAQAGDNLTICVDGQEVCSGERSQQIPVDEKATVTVTAGENTYTLNLTRPEQPDIIITEVMTDGYLDYDAAGGDNYDLIEIYNASGKDLNMLDYSIGYKKDYPYCLESATQGNWPYYFNGNDQAFRSTSSSAATYTGINTITKYSSYWDDGSVTEPDEVIFPADSTMVIWVKYTPGKVQDLEAYGSSLTYDTLIAALKAHAGTATLTVDVDGTQTAVVPDAQQLVVAEIPQEQTAGSLTSRNDVTAAKARKYFYLENHGTLTAESSARSWLFILKDTAEPAVNGSITEAGNDIISTARYIRLADCDKLSSVFSYDAERGMSLVKDLTVYDADYTAGHTSGQQGYSNLTSFGAIEYWQKPADLWDTTAPVVESVFSSGGAISLRLTDDTDVRCMELYFKSDGDSGYTRITRDFVLESGVKNGGVSADQTTIEFTYAAAGLNGTVSYYGFVQDGNGNRTSFGTAEAPMTLTVSGTAR